MADFAGRWGVEVVTDEAGAELPDAEVEVRRQGEAGLAVLWADREMSAVADNPSTTDGFANFSFMAAPGTYELTVVGRATPLVVEVEPDAFEGTSLLDHLEAMMLCTDADEPLTTELGDFILID